MSTSYRSSCRCQPTFPSLNILRVGSVPFQLPREHLMASHGSIGISSSACAHARECAPAMLSWLINKSSSSRLREAPYAGASMYSLIAVDNHRVVDVFEHASATQVLLICPHVLPVPEFVNACSVSQHHVTSYSCSGARRTRTVQLLSGLILRTVA